MKKPDPSKVKTILYAACEDMGESGVDIKTGHGRVTTDFIDLGRISKDYDPAIDYQDNDTPSKIFMYILLGMILVFLIFVIALVIRS